MLQSGTSVAEVGNWQRFLNELGFRDQNAKPLVVDEQFGRRTEYATLSYQGSRRLIGTGKVDGPTRATAKGEGFIPFVQAKSYTPSGRTDVRLIVIHTMEHPEKPSSAEDVAMWFAGRTRFDAPLASAHYTIDEDSIVQCVRDKDVAWHAPGANHDGIGVEHDGYAKQTSLEWRDSASQAILRRSAWLVARLCRLYQIPPVKLTKEGILRGEKGICGHVDVTVSYPGPRRTHWDPGQGFPYAEYLLAVTHEIRKTTS